jgi:superfamily II DNA/RNA helicase
MTDAFEVTGVSTLVEPISSVLDDLAQAVDVQETVKPSPNGFVKLGLAPELLQAVADLGFTQPTTVQLKTIPLALPSDNADTKKGFIDLMVSSTPC